MKPIYLDHNATTPVDPSVIDVMRPYMDNVFGNASSVHQYGRAAKVALEKSREQISAFISCEPSELFFTSGGTESDNIAILGIANANRSRKNHLVVGATEHHAVIESAEYLHRKEGFDLNLLPVDKEGFCSPDSLRKLINDQTSIVSIMHVNNETGTIQDIGSCAAIAHEKGVLFHTDAVQSVGKIPVDVKKLEVDLLTFTAHKIYGPKGIGALYVKQGVKVSPLFHGGSHEKKRRPGTENVAGAVGLAKALEIAIARMHEDFQRMKELSEYLIQNIKTHIPEVILNSPREKRMPHTVNMSFRGLSGESIILSLDMENIAVASGSACTSGATEPSHVLAAMGIPREVALGAVRFSLGRSTTKEQLDYVLSVLPKIIDRLRNITSNRSTNES